MKIGLVLSGGMAKGAYQIGALKAINNFIPLEDIKCISGASVGVLNGYAYLTNNLTEAEELWRKICNDDTRLLISKILKSSIIQQSISNLYIPDYKISSSFYTTLFDTKNLNVVYKNLANVSEKDLLGFLKASVAMPIYNKAVQVGQTSFFDGAIIDNIPVYPLLKHELDYIICIYFDDTCYKFENPSFDKKIIKITFPSNSILKQSVLFHKEDIVKMLTIGYEKTNFILNSVFADGYDNIDSIYKSIKIMNRTSINNSLRITGDVLVTNLNKITQKLINKKII